MVLRHRRCGLNNSWNSSILHPPSKSLCVEGTAVRKVLTSITDWTIQDWPENTKWLSEQEREMAQYRVLLSNGGKREEVSGTWDGLMEAIKDPFTWMCKCPDLCKTDLSWTSVVEAAVSGPTTLSRNSFLELHKAHADQN